MPPGSTLPSRPRLPPPRRCGASSRAAAYAAPRDSPSTRAMTVPRVANFIPASHGGLLALLILMHPQCRFEVLWFDTTHEVRGLVQDESWRENLPREPRLRPHVDHFRGDELTGDAS